MVTCGPIPPVVENTGPLSVPFSICTQRSPHFLSFSLSHAYCTLLLGCCDLRWIWLWGVEPWYRKCHLHWRPQTSSRALYNALLEDNVPTLTKLGKVSTRTRKQLLSGHCELNLDYQISIVTKMVCPTGRILLLPQCDWYRGQILFE